MRTIEDVLGGSITVGKDGPFVTRKFIVEDVDASPSEVEYTALKADKIPAYGDPHPTIPEVQCVSITAAALSPAQVAIEAQYKIFTADDMIGDRVDVESGSVTSEMETNKDREGTEMFTSHVYLERNAAGDVISQREVVQYGLVRVQVPQQYIRFTRREPENPSVWSANFIGTVNDSQWRGSDARTWLCTRIEGRTSDGGKSYEVNYEFQYNPETWDARVVFLDPDTKEPVAGSQEGTEIQYYEVYDAQQFDLLALEDV